MHNDSTQLIAAEETRPVFEDVEQRTLMSVATLEGQTLTVNAGEGDDHIELALNEDGTELRAIVNGEASEPFVASTTYFIHVNAGNGNNLVTLDPRIGAQSSVITGSGRDTVYGGAGNDYISTGGGRDKIDARAGNDTINAGSGHDKINAGSGNDFVNAGSGNDSISADGGIDKLMGRKGNDKFYADADDTVQPDGGKDQVTQSSTIAIRTDWVEAPRVTSVSIVNADSGAVVSGYEDLDVDTILDGSKLPEHYTVLANVEEGVKSVSFDLVGDKNLWKRDHDGTFSMTYDSNPSRFAAWQPTVGQTYTLNVGSNTAAYFKGLSGDVFQIKLTLKQDAAGAGTTPTPTPEPAPTPAPTQTPAPAPANDASAPKIKLNVLTADAMTGQGFHAEATGTTIPGGYGVEDARFEWNFGDPSGKHNVLPGFNAAHVYDKAGTYTMTLTVTAPGGKVSKVTQSVSVRAATMRTIYVAANGNDANEGATQDKAVKTIGRAAQLIADNTRVLIRRGDTFAVYGMAEIKNDNVEIATYGVGASPKIRYEGARTMYTLIRVNGEAQNVSITGLTFDSIYDDDAEQTNMCHAIGMSGRNITVRGNTFLNVGYAINANGSPNCAYVVDNSAPLDTGIRGYFVYAQGSNIAIVGNSVANSTREHAVRLTVFTNALVAENDLTNLDRRGIGSETQDFSKATVNVQRGAYAYVADNTVHDGNIAMGPLGGGDGLSQKEFRFAHGVIDGNTIDNTRIQIEHGVDGITVRNNVIDFDDETQILVRGWNADYGRGVNDLVIDHNVGINHALHGRFMELSGHADGTVLTNNVYVAPNLTPGGWGASAINMAESNMSSFKTVNGNVWPTGDRSSASVAGGLNWVGSTYVTAGTWNAYSNVGTDSVSDADLSASDALKLRPSMIKAAA